MDSISVPIAMPNNFKTLRGLKHWPIRSSKTTAVASDPTLTGSILETGAYGVPSKSQNPTVLG